MAEFLRRKELSLDTNIVLDLADEKDFAHEFRELFRSRHYTLLLPPTALHELSTIEFEGETERERKLARTGLTQLRTWGVQMDAPLNAIECNPPLRFSPCLRTDQPAGSEPCNTGC